MVTLLLHVEIDEKLAEYAAISGLPTGYRDKQHSNRKVLTNGIHLLKRNRGMTCAERSKTCAKFATWAVLIYDVKLVSQQYGACVRIAHARRTERLGQRRSAIVLPHNR